MRLSACSFLSRYIFHPEEASTRGRVCCGAMSERTAAYILTIGLGIGSFGLFPLVVGFCWLLRCGKQSLETRQLLAGKHFPQIQKKVYHPRSGEGYIRAVDAQFGEWCTKFLGVDFYDIPQITKWPDKYPLPQPHLVAIGKNIYECFAERDVYHALTGKNETRPQVYLVALVAYNQTKGQWEWQGLNRNFCQRDHSEPVFSEWGFVFGTEIPNTPVGLVTNSLTEQYWNQKAVELGTILGKLLKGEEVVIRGDTYSITGPESTTSINFEMLGH